MNFEQQIKLTSLTTKGGCGCKIGPADLSGILDTLPNGSPDPQVLIGTETGDDAGVYQINDETAIIQTTDFFTPIVDGPYDFGQIAAANAISDIYAMGGTPITALNIVAFPISTLDKDILAEILRGASDKAHEAGVALLGGHSIDDPEPKFGLAVTGAIHPDAIWTNTGAKPGDALILTKPIGLGILTTAIKRDLLHEDERKHVTEIMATLNQSAAKVLSAYHVHASTDVTGFGLLGHASEMAAGSHVGLSIHMEDVPILPRVRELAEQGVIPGGTKNNFDHLTETVTYPDSMEKIDKLMLCDAVTSGGLLVSVSQEEKDDILRDMADNGVNAVQIGAVHAENKGKITVKHESIRR